MLVKLGISCGGLPPLSRYSKFPVHIYAYCTMSGFSIITSVSFDRRERPIEVQNHLPQHCRMLFRVVNSRRGIYIVVWKPGTPKQLTIKTFKGKS